MKNLYHAIIACSLLLCANPVFASQQLMVNNTNAIVPSTTPQLLLPSRSAANRQLLEIQNQDPSTSVYIGTTPGTNGLLLKPGQDYSPAINVPGNAIYIWLSSGTATGPTIAWEG